MWHIVQSEEPVRTETTYTSLSIRVTIFKLMLSMFFFSVSYCKQKPITTLKITFIPVVSSSDVHFKLGIIWK